MESFVKLDNRDREDAITFLKNNPSHAMIMLYDIVNVGMDPGDTCIHGHYFGRRRDKDLVAIAAYYGLGSMFIWAKEDRYLKGFGDYMAETGILPAMIGGESLQVDSVLKEAKGLLDVRQVIKLDLMRADETNRVPYMGNVEQADINMLDELIGISREFEKEQFGEVTTSDEDNRFLHRRHVEDQASFIIRNGGRIASKADGLRVDGAGGQVLRVFTVPEERSKGYAAACVAKLSSNMMEDGKAVFLEVKSDNRPAIRAYEKAGFKKIADRTFIASAAPE